MNKRLLTVPALGALLTFGLVACDDDNTAQLDAWAKGVCDAAKSPIAQSRTALADIGTVTPGEAPVDLQKRLSADLAALAKANQGLADVVAKAGAPKSADGAEAQTGAVNELRQAGQGYVEAQKKLDALATADQARFADGLRSVGDQVQQLAQLSTQGLNRLQTGEAGDAMKRQTGCKASSAGTNPSGAAASPGAGQTGAGQTGAGQPGDGTSGAPSGKASGKASGRPGAGSSAASPSGNASGKSADGDTASPAPSGSSD